MEPLATRFPPELATSDNLPVESWLIASPPGAWLNDETYYVTKGYGDHDQESGAIQLIVSVWPTPYELIQIGRGQASFEIVGPWASIAWDTNCPRPKNADTEHVAALQMRHAPFVCCFLLLALRFNPRARKKPWTQRFITLESLHWTEFRRDRDEACRIRVVSFF